MKIYTVPESVLQAVFNYLASRPYSEVANIVQGLQQTVRLVANGNTVAELAPESAAPDAPQATEEETSQTQAAN